MRTALLLLTLAAAPANAQQFGAIAFSERTGAWGWSSGYDSRGEAERRALGECVARGGPCVVATWFRDACGALAKSPDNGWGGEWGNSVSEAQSKAMSRCVAEGNRGCQVIESACSWY